MRIMLLAERWDIDQFDLITPDNAPLPEAVKGVCHKRLSQYNVTPTITTTQTIKESEAETENGTETIVRYVKRTIPNPFLETWNKTGSHHTTHVNEKNGLLTLHKREQEQQWFVDVADLKGLLGLLEDSVLRVESGIDHGYADVPLVAIV